MSLPSPSPISVRLQPSLVASLDAIAKALDRDRSWVIAKALASYVERDGAVVLREAQGIAELNAGDDHDFDEVIREARSIIARGVDGSAR